jgi:hypothetical protein
MPVTIKDSSIIIKKESPPARTIKTEEAIVLDTLKSGPRSEKISETHVSREFEQFALFCSDDSALFNVKPGPIFRSNRSEEVTFTHKIEQVAHFYHRSYLNWTLLVGLVSVILLLTLKTYYRKFTSKVLTTLVNVQLADKMFREKNIVVRRAFFLMNLNFVLVLSLFILLLSIYWSFRITDSYVLDYLIILVVVIGILIARLIIYYLAGYLFDRLPPVNEQIHLIYLVNKNLGLILLPIAFIAIYTSARFSEIVLYSGLLIILIATLYKLIRGFQIIKRSGILLFYAILYLCTLELLPLVLGSKLLISLR